MIQRSEVVATRIMPKGYSFGVREDTGEHVFVPPALTSKLNWQEGDTCMMTVTTNVMGDRSKTPWRAINFQKIQSGAPDVLMTRIVDLMADENARTQSQIAEELNVSSALVSEALGQLHLYRIQITSATGLVKHTYYAATEGAAVEIVEAKVE